MLPVVYFLKTHFWNILDCFLIVLFPWPPCKAFASSRLCPTAPMYGFDTLYGFHTEDRSAWKSRWEKEQDHVSSFCLKFQPHRAPGDLLLFFTRFFFPCRCLILSTQTLPHQAQGKVCDVLMVCTGTSSSWCGSSISGAWSAHLHMETIWGWGHHLFCGSGCLPQTQFPPLGMQDWWQLTVIPLMTKVPFLIGLWRRKRAVYA